MAHPNSTSDPSRRLSRGTLRIVSGYSLALIPLALIPLGVLALIVVGLVTLVGRRRTAYNDGRPERSALIVSLLALSFIAWCILAVSLGVTTHSIAEAIKQSPGPGCEPFQPCSNYGPTFTTDQYVSQAVLAGLFFIVSLLAFAGINWRIGKDRGSDLARPSIGAYSIFVALISAVAVLVLIPLAGDAIFQAVAPRVNGIHGFAPGLTNLVTEVALLAVFVPSVIVYGRIANRWRRRSPGPQDPSSAGA